MRMRIKYGSVRRRMRKIEDWVWICGNENED